jgi:hypothetical protein
MIVMKHPIITVAVSPAARQVKATLTMDRRTQDNASHLHEGENEGLVTNAMAHDHQFAHDGHRVIPRTNYREGVLVGQREYQEAGADRQQFVWRVVQPVCNIPSVDAYDSATENEEAAWRKSTTADDNDAGQLPLIMAVRRIHGRWIFERTAGEVATTILLPITSPENNARER